MKPCRWRAVLFASGTLLITACGSGPEIVDAPGLVEPALEADGFLTDDGRRLPLMRWGPQDPDVVVLGIHGFTEHARSLTRLAVPLGEAGVAFYAYDQRGFGTTPSRGTWPGEDRLVHDARTAHRLLQERHHGVPIYFIGKSMGGAVVALAVTGDDAVETSGVILVSPAVWARRTMPWYQRFALWVGDHLAPGVVFRPRLVHRVVEITPTDDPDVWYEMRNDPLLLREVRTDMLAGVTDLMDKALTRMGDLPEPALVMYGLRDDIIPLNAACAMLEQIDDDTAPRQRVVLYENGYHMLTRDLRAHETQADMIAWLRDQQGPLPSGGETGFAEARARLCEQ